MIPTLSNRETIDTISKRLMGNLQTYYPELTTSGTAIKGTAIGGQFAKTFRFDLNFKEGKRIVYGKWCPVFDNINPARMEYETLVLLYYKMPEINKFFAVSRPLDFFPDLNVYVMESVGILNFKTYLLKNNSRLRKGDSINELVSVLKGSALWLKIFHEITRSDNVKKFDVLSLQNKMLEDYDYRYLWNFTFRRVTLNKLDILLNRLSLLGSKLDLPCAKWHWDYTPAHIYLDNGKISVIDILGLDDAPIYEDIGHFLAAMETVNNLPFYLLFDRMRAGKEFCDIFLDEYGTMGGSEREIFLLFSNIYKLKFLILYFGGHHMKVSKYIYSVGAKVYANTRTVGLFDEPIERTINEINYLLDKLI